MRSRSEQHVCGAPRCDRPSTLVYLGLRLCDRHWERLCAIDDYRKMRALAWRWGAREETSSQ